MNKFLLILLLNLISAHPLYAMAVEQKELNFKIEPMGLLKGEVHYSFTLLSPKKLVKAFPEAQDFDSQGILKQKKVAVMLTKAIYVVDQPVGRFDQDHVTDLEFMSTIMGQQKVEQISSHLFQISVPGSAPHTYKIKSYFDSDDISSLPNRKVIQGVTAAKKLDVIVQSSQSIVFREYFDYSKYVVGGSSVTSHIPLKEGKTMVITYGLFAIEKKYALPDVLKANYVREVEGVRDLINGLKN